MVVMWGCGGVFQLFSGGWGFGLGGKTVHAFEGDACGAPSVEEHFYGPDGAEHHGDNA